MFRSRGLRFLILVVCLLTSLPAFAQLTTGGVIGTVTDDSGAALPGVTVTAKNTATGVARVAVSESDGSFSIPRLQPGTYDVTAELEGFRPAVAREVAVNLGVSVTARLRLHAAGPAPLTAPGARRPA